MSQNHISKSPPRLLLPLGKSSEVLEVPSCRTPKVSPSRNTVGSSSAQMKLPLRIRRAKIPLSFVGFNAGMFGSADAAVVLGRHRMLLPETRTSPCRAMLWYPKGGTTGGLPAGGFRLAIPKGISTLRKQVGRVMVAGSTRVSHSTLIPPRILDTNKSVSLVRGEAAPFVSSATTCTMCMEGSDSGANTFRQSCNTVRVGRRWLLGGLVGGLGSAGRLQRTMASGQRCRRIPIGGASVRASTEPSALRAANCQ